MCLPTMRGWTGREVSLALEAASAWTFCAMPPENGTFVDRVYEAVKAGVSKRLEGQSDG